MRTPRLRVPSRENFVACFEKNQDNVRHELLNPVAIERRKDVREVVRAHVDDDADTLGVFMRADFLEERLDQSDRQVVRAIEADVFQRRLHVTLPRAGEAGDDDEVFGARHRFEVYPERRLRISGGGEGSLL